MRLNNFFGLARFRAIVFRFQTVVWTARCQDWFISNTVVNTLLHHGTLFFGFVLHGEYITELNFNIGPKISFVWGIKNNKGTLTRESGTATEASSPWTLPAALATQAKGNDGRRFAATSVLANGAYWFTILVDLPETSAPREVSSAVFSLFFSNPFY